MEFSDSLNYENIVKHVLVRVRNIHESVLYQAFFCLFFELAKNEEGPEFSFLDSLNLYKKEGREVHSHVFYIMAASLVSLNKAPVLSLSTVGSYCFDLNPIQSFLLLLLVSFPIIWGICQCLLHCRFVLLVLLCQMLPKSLLCHAHCSRIKPLSAIL